MKTQTATQQDRDLRERVIERIEGHHDITSSDIGVTARDGVIHLTGFVHRYPEKVLAERAAQQVPGVCGVANDIQVAPKCQATDPEIARSVAFALAERSDVPKACIHLSVRNGFVTLEGRTTCEAERKAAADCVHGVGGVRGVTNLIAAPRNPVAEE